MMRTAGGEGPRSTALAVAADCGTVSAAGGPGTAPGFVTAGAAVGACAVAVVALDDAAATPAVFSLAPLAL